MTFQKPQPKEGAKSVKENTEPILEVVKKIAPETLIGNVLNKVLNKKEEENWRNKKPSAETTKNDFTKNSETDTDYEFTSKLPVYVSPGEGGTAHVIGRKNLYYGPKDQYDSKDFSWRPDGSYKSAPPDNFSNKIQKKVEENPHPLTEKDISGIDKMFKKAVLKNEIFEIEKEIQSILNPPTIESSEIVPKQEVEEALLKNSQKEQKHNEDKINELLEQELPENKKTNLLKDTSPTFFLKKIINSKEGNKTQKNPRKSKIILRKIKRGLKKLIFIGSLFVLSTGVENKDGELKYDTNKLLETLIIPLPQTQEEWAKRLFVNQGVYNLEESSLVLEETKEEKEARSKKRAIQELLEIQKLEKNYFDALTEFSILGVVPDSHNKNDSLFSYRSQWVNEQGFDYIPTPRLGSRGSNVRFSDVVGVGHFLFDSDVSKKEIFMHLNTKNLLNEQIAQNKFITVFSHNQNNLVTVRYKRASELEKTDTILNPLRQFSWSQIDWTKDGPVQGKGFASHIRAILLKNGGPTHLMHNGSRDAFSRFSGGSVVFIFEDKQKNRIVRDFSGTINQIQHEGEQILEEFHLLPDDLTLGYHDVGAFSAKPKAHKGVLDMKQYLGFHTAPYTGGALLIPLSAVKEYKN